MKLSVVVSGVLALAVLAGCAVFAPEERTEPPVKLPATYALYTESEPGPGEWWRAFNSTELDILVATALGDNFDLRAALAKVRQARAVARKSGSYLFPTLDGEGAAGQTKSWQQPDSRSDHVFTDSESYSLGLAAAYEVDVWGKYVSQREADTLKAKAAKQDLQAAAVTVSASVATTWIDLLATRREVDILKEQIRINTSQLEIQQLRFEKGLAAALDVTQQRELLVSNQAQLPLLESREQVLVNTLAALLGKASPVEVEVEQRQLPNLIPLPATGLPADLLSARPDVRAAGLRLTSSDWSVSVARADRLPSLKLSATAAFSSGAVDTLFTNWISTLAAGVTGPIFDAGRRAAEVDRTRAVVQERLADYGNVVLKAVYEVQDGLVKEMRQHEHIGRLEEQLAVAKLGLLEARIRYLKGLSDYLNYLTQLVSVQSLERTIIGEKSQLIKYRVDLYRALGGDWTRHLATPADNPDEKEEKAWRWQG